MVARRVGEHRAAAPLADRLGGLAPLQQRAHLRFIDPGLALECQSRGDEPLVPGRALDVAVADRVLTGRARMHPAVTVDRLDLRDMAPGLPAERAGVHRERTPQGAGNTGKEFRRAQPPLHALLRHSGAGHARLAVDRRLAAAIQAIERAMRADDDAFEPPVAHEDVAPKTQPVDRHVLVQAPQEARQISAIARREEHLRRSADMPRCMAAQRLIALHTSGEFGCDGHGHEGSLRGVSARSRAGSSWATALMWPAPMVTMTSPSRMMSLSDS